MKDSSSSRLYVEKHLNGNAGTWANAWSQIVLFSTRCAVIWWWLVGIRKSVIRIHSTNPIACVIKRSAQYSVLVQVQRRGRRLLPRKECTFHFHPLRTCVADHPLEKRFFILLSTLRLQFLHALTRRTGRRTLGTKKRSEFVTAFWIVDHSREVCESRKVLFSMQILIFDKIDGWEIPIATSKTCCIRRSRSPCPTDS